MSNSSLMSNVSQKTEKSEKENEKVLSADPEEAFFNPAGGKSEHMLVNCGDTRLAVKVRCSYNPLYRVHPVYMFVESGQAVSLEVTRLAGPARKDKLIVQFIPCNPEMKVAELKEFMKKELDKNPNLPNIKIELKMMSDKVKKMSYEIIEEGL